MLILLSVISAIILLAGIIVYEKKGKELYRQDKEWIYWTLNIVGGVALFILAIVIIVVGAYYSKRMVIDEKIELYQHENANIEQSISVLVGEYMNWETDTYESFNGESSITLVNLYPELKSNELVVKQIDTYVSNNATIKQLECERLEYKVYAWWLFFGE